MTHYVQQTWANYGPLAISGPPVLSFWPADTYRNLNSHHELSGRLFFPSEITDGSDFQKNKPQRCKIEMKQEVKIFYFGNHIRTWTVISRKIKKIKRSSPCFPIQQFSKSGHSCKKLAHPCYKAYIYCGHSLQQMA